MPRDSHRQPPRRREADDLQFHPAQAGDWSVEPDSVGEAIDRVAGRAGILAFPYGDLVVGSTEGSQYLTAAGNVEFSANEGYRIPFSGFLIAHSLVGIVGLATSGSIEVQARLNSTEVSALTQVITASGGTGARTWDIVLERSDWVPFSSVATIQAFIDTSGGGVGFDSLIGVIYALVTP